MNKHMQTLESIKTMADKIRKCTINESINFEDDSQFEKEEFPVEDTTEEIEFNKEQEKEPKSVEDRGLEELDETGELDKIRSITLSGMQKLYKQPESPEFQALYKIFQICNKGVEKDEKQQI